MAAVNFHMSRPGGVNAPHFCPCLGETADDEKTLYGSVRTRHSPTSSSASDFVALRAAVADAGQRRRIQDAALKALKSGERVNVSPMFIFLSRDGTVISTHSTPSLDMTAPITSRRNTHQNKIKKFEPQIMLRPSVETVRELHILSVDLILHRRTLKPIKTVVYGLRRYDVDRAAATVDMPAG
ncbi:hypothetical protein C8R44DRAFT_737950 [Mycena epipterygia]|nr:hypothetical protein C8R44DRAFT_737950 [Mycena epipterygia]